MTVQFSTDAPRVEHTGTALQIWRQHNVRTIWRANDKAKSDERANRIYKRIAVALIAILAACFAL